MVKEENAHVHYKYALLHMSMNCARVHSHIIYNVYAGANDNGASTPSE